MEALLYTMLPLAVVGDVREQALEQGEPRSDGPGHPVPRRGLPVPADGAAGRFLRAALRLPPDAAGLRPEGPQRDVRLRADAGRRPRQAQGAS